jgi:hypothetical protein
MIKNIGFAIQSSNDERVEPELEGEFGSDSYCVSRNAHFLGLTRNDTCEPPCLCEDTLDDEDESEDLYGYEDYEDTDVSAAVSEAVEDALALQEFFRLKKMAEERAEHEALVREAMREVEELLAEARKAMAEAAELYPEDYDEPKELKVEVVERAMCVKRSISGVGYNKKMRECPDFVRIQRSYEDYDGQKITYTESRVVGHHFALAQRCHGGTDNRRYRRGDISGKMIGHNHRRRYKDHGRDRMELRPVAINLHTPDGTIRRLRVA